MQNRFKDDTINENKKGRIKMSFREVYQDKINKFIELTRGYTLPTSMAPWFVAAAAASVSGHYYSDIKIKLFTTLLSFVAIICIHLGVNLLDDYIDINKKIKNGTPLRDIKFHDKARNKGRLIINGTFSLENVRLILYILFGIGITAGTFFTYLYGMRIPAIAGIAGILCLFYPFSSKFCVGEIIIGIIFGPLLVMGTYIALCGRFSIPLLILSIAIGLMIVVLSEAHNVMDFDYDKKTDKKTLCTLIGTKKGSLVLIAFEILSAYAIVLYLAISGQFSYWILLSILFTTPLNVKLIASLNDYNNVKDLKFIPKWYLGPMDNWDIIQKERLEYFMYRFYIARNIGFIFCVTLAVVCFFTIKVNYIYI